MASILKAVRGTRDLLPPETALWNHVEATARAVFARYGFGEIRTPVFEETTLFARGVGEETDIVSKEMYTWEDRDRFNEQALVDAWLALEENEYYKLEKNVRIGKREIDIVARRKGASGREVIEVVEFKSDISQSAFDQVAFFKAEYEKLYPDTLILGLLVIPAQRNVSASMAEKASSQNISIKTLGGDFFQSAQKLTLRPENTAGVVRAYIEHKLGETGQLQKLFYIGPQFRRERPQKGRYRQFWQIGAEVIGAPTSGSESPVRDAEVLEMLSSLLNELGIKGWRLEINSVGNAEDRKRYNAALREALAPVKEQMCEDNRRRAETNPLRVLDSKAPEDQEIINALPKIADYLGEDSRAHFTEVLAALDACGVSYHVNPRLVRGLDYYTRTTFEFTVDTGLGTQNALLGGGRYDGLSEMLGGPKAPGIGFAIGEDRLILTLQAQIEAAAAAGASAVADKMDAYIAPMGEAQNAAALALAKELRAAGLSIEVGDGTFRLKKSFEAADKVARRILILGEDEVKSGEVTVKTFASGEQVKVGRGELAELLKA